MSSKQTLGILASTVLLGSLAVPCFGQTTNPSDAPPAAGGQGNDRPRFDPSQFRQRMLDRLKQDLGSSDDEFQALQPKIEKVFQVQMELNTGRFGGRRNRGAGSDSASNANQTQAPVPAASSELRKTLENKDAKPEEIKAKLDALREAKTKAKADLAAAQQDLRGVLTQRQEAVLVMSGLLD
jgi:chromosome segregation ATPase